VDRLSFTARPGVVTGFLRPNGSGKSTTMWAVGVLVFDEPMNGQDPEGIRWIRDLMRSLAADGRTFLMSSRHMSQMALAPTGSSLSAAAS
jgi:ABC-type multidrug transport system ATPase subunit